MARLSLGKRGKPKALPRPPGQRKQAAGAQSARQFAPGQMKKVAGVQSARQFAPGQQGKTPSGAPTAPISRTVGEVPQPAQPAEKPSLTFRPRIARPPVVSSQRRKY